MIDPYGPVPLQDAADSLGVPAAQIARWCADGTLAPYVDEHGTETRYFTGWPGARSTLRITGDGLQKLREGILQAA